MRHIRRLAEHNRSELALGGAFGVPKLKPGSECLDVCEPVVDMIAMTYLGGGCDGNTIREPGMV